MQKSFPFYICIAAHCFLLVQSACQSDQICQWASWHDWSTCNATCGSGMQSRWRGPCCDGEIELDFIGCIKHCNLSMSYREHKKCSACPFPPTTVQRTTDQTTEIIMTTTHVSSTKNIPTSQSTTVHFLPSVKLPTKASTTKQEPLTTTEKTTSTKTLSTTTNLHTESSTIKETVKTTEKFSFLTLPHSKSALEKATTVHVLPTTTKLSLVSSNNSEAKAASSEPGKTFSDAVVAGAVVGGLCIPAGAVLIVCVVKRWMIKKRNVKNILPARAARVKQAWSI